MISSVATGLGNSLREFHLNDLARSAIDAEYAARAHLWSVDSPTGRDILCRAGVGDYSGLAFPYFWPGQDRVRDYRVRLDHPETEYRNGVLRPKARYLCPPGRAPMFYFPPDTDPRWLDDVSLNIILTEGEKKGLALGVLSCHALGDAADRPRWLAIAIPGVWGFRGKRGRLEGAHGGWDVVKGSIADFDRVRWDGRKVIILFDANIHTNAGVRWARHRLAEVLRERGARVEFIDLPKDVEVNGVDDLIYQWGHERVLKLIETGVYDPVATSKAIRLTEIGNAKRLVEAYGEDLHYCEQTGMWLVWDETRFAPNQIKTVERYARNVVEQLGKDAFIIESKEERAAAVRFALRSDSDHGVRALLNRAAAEEGVAILLNDLDTDNWVLNVGNGTIDLRTGELLPHSRDDLISKLAPVHFDPHAQCPRWLQFLDEVFAPHPDASGYLQRAVGYSLTGDIREECLFLLYGTGRNGKGTIFRTLQAMLGDYAGTADFSTFIAARDDHGPRDDVANMRGRRLMTSQEAREGAALAESLVKWLTGGDVVRARNLYERSSEWLPTHHLFLAVNHKPIIRGTDSGIWSRLRLIPFDVSFEGREDKTLKETLRNEVPGILNWAVAGCLAWQRDGLGECESVGVATRAYRSESDAIGQFIEDTCILAPNAQVEARRLYNAFRYWAERSGEDVLSETAFALRLVERGLKKERKGTGVLYLGLGLRRAGQ